MSKIYVVWHKNPDTDAIVSALAYAEYLSDKWHQAVPIALWEPNNETIHVLEQAWYTMPEIISTLPEWSRLVLVDHNEISQSVDQRDDHEIIWVVDHHKFWWFSTNAPLHMRVEPIWSTASILHKIFNENEYTPSPDLAKLLTSAILSDTLHFRSPTTTDEDKKIVAELQRAAWIDNLDDFAMAMFQAKSDLWDIDAESLVTLDYKIFQFDTATVWFGVVETTNPGYALWRKEEIIDAMNSIKKREWLDYIFLSVVDILQQQNQTFVAWDVEAKVLEDVFDADIADWIADLWERISRKKQLAAPLSDYFS